MTEKKVKIGIIGDYNASMTAHVCLPEALKISAKGLKISVEQIWLPTDDINLMSPSEKESFDGYWCAPGSPYKNRLAALSLIHFARTSQKAYLGTCGGYQHAIVEFAVNELGLKSAGIEEEEPDSSMPVIAALGCRLNDEKRAIQISAGSKLSTIMQKIEITEEYRCGFGMNPQYSYLFEKSDLQFCAFNQDKAPQAFELKNHRFFIGTAFQPERSSRQGVNHPLVRAFLQATLDG
jgi:CTP synthase (UTP-ammonia lyase)